MSTTTTIGRPVSRTGRAALAVVALLGALAKLLQVREGIAQVAVRLEWQRIAFRGSQEDIKRREPRLPGRD